MASKKRFGTEEGARPSKVSKTGAATAMVTTRRMSRYMVTNAVFLTTELLEIVLQNLSMRDLLLAQRVCRKWRDVIAANDKFQQALFFKPAPAEFTWTYDNLTQTLTKHKAEGIPLILPSREGLPGGTRTLICARLNTLLFKVPEGRYDILHRACHCNLGSEVFQIKFRPSVRRAEASWRRMLVTQPATEYFWGQWAYTMDHGRRKTITHEADNVFDATGIRADNLIRTCEITETGGRQVEFYGAFFEMSKMLFPTQQEMAADTISPADLQRWALEE